MSSILLSTAVSIKPRHTESDSTLMSYPDVFTDHKLSFSKDELSTIYWSCEASGVTDLLTT